MKKMATEFWNSLLTEKSWNILNEFVREHKFILIGGWAVYLLTRQLKSKDIDIVVSIDELQRLKSEGLRKNDNLKKYEIKKGEVDIDIYVEHFSRLAIPVEDIKRYTVKIEGFEVACPELLLIMKQSAYKDRENSVKGEKDKIDINSLIFFSNIDFVKYEEILKNYGLESYFSELILVIKSFKDYEKLNLNPREFKIRKSRILSNITGAR